jgi:hypothetical protein
MRKVFVAAATVAIFALLVMPAFAKPGGNGGGKGGGGGQQVVASSSIVLEDYSYLHFGGEVGFATEAAGLAGWEWPMVTVWCYQDLNGDGVREFPEDDGDLVYAQMDHPDVEFVLGGGSSDWLTSGGPAECKAKLYAYGNKSGNESIRELASTEWFHVEA